MVALERQMDNKVLSGEEHLAKLQHPGRVHRNHRHLRVGGAALPLDGQPAEHFEEYIDHRGHCAWHDAGDHCRGHRPFKRARPCHGRSGAHPSAAHGQRGRQSRGSAGCCHPCMHCRCHGIRLLERDHHHQGQPSPLHLSRWRWESLRGPSSCISCAGPR